MHFTGDVCVIHADQIVCVMWIKPPSSLHSFPYSTERKEIQRICLHSRNARINWEDCVSVPRVGDSCFTRNVWGWTFPFASASFAGEETLAPISQEELDSPPSLAEGGPPALGRTHGQTGPPSGPTEGGAAAGAAERGFAPRSWPWPGCECGGGSGPWLGAGQDSNPGGSGGARGRRGEARFSSKNAHQNFCFYLPPFLKAKAIIYRPFRFAVFSI